MVIGDRLRELRKAKNLSQEDVEERAGLLCCYLSGVENGETVPAIETLEGIACALDVPLYQLFYDGELPALPNLPNRRSAEEIAASSSGGAKLTAERGTRDGRSRVQRFEWFSNQTGYIVPSKLGSRGRRDGFTLPALQKHEPQESLPSLRRGALSGGYAHTPDGCAHRKWWAGYDCR